MALFAVTEFDKNLWQREEKRGALTQHPHSSKVAVSGVQSIKATPVCWGHPALDGLAQWQAREARERCLPREVSFHQHLFFKALINPLVAGATLAQKSRGTCFCVWVQRGPIFNLAKA